MRIAAVLAAAIAVIALTACGGSKGSTSNDGKQIFSDAGCSGCHKLAAAGSDGGSGPDLDDIKLDATAVASQVKSGGGGMPGFEGDLTPEQITAVSEFVAANDGSQ